MVPDYRNRNAIVCAPPVEPYQVRETYTWGSRGCPTCACGCSEFVVMPPDQFAYLQEMTPKGVVVRTLDRAGVVVEKRPPSNRHERRRAAALRRSA